jgi:hypothetical protein
MLDTQRRLFLPLQQFLPIRAYLSIMPLTSYISSDLTCTRSSNDLDNHIKGLIKCESCSKTFTTRGGYKCDTMFVLESSF